MTASARIAIEASSRGAVAASSLQALQGLRHAGNLGPGGEAGGFDSFQARLHSMLAALAPGAGADEAHEAEAIDAAEPETEGSSAATVLAGSGRRSAALSDGASAVAALPGQQVLASLGSWKPSGATRQPTGKANQDAANLDQASMETTKLNAANLDTTSLDKSSIAKSSETKPDSAGTARAASHTGKVNPTRRQASEPSEPLSAANVVVANVVPAPLAVVSPIAPKVAIQPAGSSLKSVSPSGDETALPGAVAYRSGSHVQEKPGAGAEVAGAKPAVSASTGIPTGSVDLSSADGLSADAPEPAAPAISAGGASASAEHGAGIPSSGTGQSHPAVTADALAPAPLALAGDSQAENNSVDPALASSPSPAGGEFTQAIGLSASRTSSRSTPQLASVRSHSATDSALLAGRTGAAEPSGAADASLLARHPAGGSGEVHGLSGAPASGSPAATGSRETFAALDAEPAAGAPNWIHAGARQAEAGFQDPALGWVGVRADLSGGGVHASIVPGSAEAAQSLSGHLAGLNAHLAAEQIPVDSLRMAHTPENGYSGGNQGANQGATQGGQQGAGQGTQQQGEHSGQGLTSPSGIGSQFGQGAARGSVAGQPEPRTSSSVSPGPFANGTHISVVA